MILDLLTANPDGLTLGGLCDHGADVGTLAHLVGSGAVALIPGAADGVDVYRLAAPVVPKAKAAPTSKMVPIALMDGLADALDEPRGTLMSDLVRRVEVLREQLDAAIAAARPESSTTPAAAQVHAGWRARYERTTPSGVDLAVVPNNDGWSWIIIDGAQTLGRGVVEVDDAAKAIGCCDAVAAVLA
jgi:hypothetical protein